MSRTKTEAIAFLTARWREQAEQFTLMRESVPLGLYLSRNLWHAMHNNQQKQKPCDVGLFSDDARQTDLIDAIRSRNAATQR